MNSLVVLAMLLAILMIGLGGKKGLRSFITLFINFALFIVLLFFMNIPEVNPVILTMFICIIISFINLFYINGTNTMTKTAFTSTVFTTLLLSGLILYFANATLIQGFGKEETEELSMASLRIGIDFSKVAVAVIMMSTIGAITDASIAIASPMKEMHQLKPDIDRKNLFIFGLSIGKDIIGTSMNTLFFAFVGSYLALLILFSDLSYSWSEMINSKIFSGEVVTIACSAIGLIAVIPITAFCTSYVLTKKTPPSHQEN